VSEHSVARDGADGRGRSPRPSPIRVRGQSLVRPNGVLLALALFLAIAATVFGAVALPSEHHGEPGAGHEHATPVADHHEGEGEDAGVLDASGVLAALALSALAVALVPIGLRGTRPADPPDARRFAVAVASAGAATIHFAVADQHFAEYFLFGAFFVVVGLAQLGWVVAVVSNPTRTVYLVGAVGNALVAATWVVSRTTGLPFGPEAGDPEPVGIADVVSTVFEVAIVVGALLLLLAHGPPVWGVRFVRPAVAIAAIAMTALALVGLAGL
jgi:hypothetical protein